MYSEKTKRAIQGGGMRTACCEIEFKKKKGTGILWGFLGAQHKFGRLWRCKLYSSSIASYFVSDDVSHFAIFSFRVSFVGFFLRFVSRVVRTDEFVSGNGRERGEGKRKDEYLSVRINNNIRCRWVVR